MVIDYSAPHVTSLSVIKKPFHKQSVCQATERYQPVKKNTGHAQLSTPADMESTIRWFFSQILKDRHLLYFHIDARFRLDIRQTAGACKARRSGAVNERPKCLYYDPTLCQNIMQTNNLNDLHHKSRDDPGDHCAGKATGRAV